MRKIQFLLVGLLAAAMVLLVGCATMSEQDQSRHATIFVTMKVIEESSLTADDVLGMVETARAGSDAEVSFDGLRQELLDELGFDGLSPADRYLAGLLVDSLLPELPDGGVSPGELPDELLQRLEWIEEAAYLAGGGQ